MTSSSFLVDDDGFQKVISKKKRNLVYKKNLSQDNGRKHEEVLDLNFNSFIKRYFGTDHDENIQHPICSSIDKIRLLSKMNSIREEIINTSFFEFAKATIIDIHEKNPNFKLKRIICLGLGSFGYFDYTPLYQLVFILEIQKFFQISFVEFQDPVFTTEEIDFLQNDLNSKIIEDLNGKYEVDNDNILFYLPHVTIVLTNNLLWKNWDPNKLTNIILMQNSFDHIKFNEIHIDILRELYVGKIMDYTKEYIPPPLCKTNKLEMKFELAFNNTSIHIFPKEKLDQIIDKNFWTDCIEPKRQNKNGAELNL